MVFCNTRTYEERFLGRQVMVCERDAYRIILNSAMLCKSTVSVSKCSKPKNIKTHRERCTDTQLVTPPHVDKEREDRDKDRGQSPEKTEHD